MKDSFWQEHLCYLGFRLTVPRKIVINILKETEKHLSAEDIYVKALKINPSIGLTSIYRTLLLFTKINVVQKHDFGEKKARYELINNPLKKEHHHHLICTRCKTVIDYADFMKEEVELMTKTENKLSKKYHFKIIYHTVHFYGLCVKCQKLA
ncbi:transcriptional repressor [candidate division KSB1 bacterium]|nr:transcriptional repressor [candidate division KSB1 bacterium]